jgi:hypothetical protein
VIERKPDGAPRVAGEDEKDEEDEEDESART